MDKHNIFKKCPMCGTVWTDRMQFVRDPSLQLNGYQVDFERLGQGLFYFTHNIDDCHSTMALVVEDFYDLNPGRRIAQRETGSKKCPGYCLRKEELERCTEVCECSFVRDIINIITENKNMKN